MSQLSGNVPKMIAIYKNFGFSDPHRRALSLDVTHILMGIDQTNLVVSVENRSNRRIV